jgi:protein SCO1/2
MRRRTFLTATASGTVAGVAGCLGEFGGSGGNADTHLSAPDTDHDPETLPYPAYGQALPEVTLTDPIADREVTTTEFDRDVLMTFFYSHCMSVCPVLIAAMEGVQERAAAKGYGDDVVFLAVTFDPQRDDGERLRKYAKQRDVDLDAGNWHFLRPDSPDRAKTVVQETFGVNFRRTSGMGGGTTTGSGGETSSKPDADAETETVTSADTTTDATTPAATGNYMFTHLGLILLANRDGFVERAYQGNAPAWKPIYEDFETLRKREP